MIVKLIGDKSLHGFLSSAKRLFISFRLYALDLNHPPAADALAAVRRPFVTALCARGIISIA
jgi:hypothetical protein